MQAAMVTWQLYKSGWSGPTISLSDIAAGDYDSDLRRAADLAKGLPFEVMIRFGHEMNGDWYPWSGQPVRLRRGVAPHRLGLQAGGRRQRQVGLVAERRSGQLPVRPVLPRRLLGRLRGPRRLQLGNVRGRRPTDGRACPRSSPPPTSS